MAKTYYGDPYENEVLTSTSGITSNPPPDVEIGDELCDGHQTHYIWDGEGWS